MIRRRTECTANTPRCRTAQNYQAQTRACCRRHIRDLLAGVQELFAAHDITWWADYGTLLGAVRHGGLIPHDKDADIGILAEDFERLLALDVHTNPWHDTSRGRPNRTRPMAGFIWNHKPPRQPDEADGAEFTAGDSIKVWLSAKNQTNVDIFPWHRRDDGTFYRTRYVNVDRFKGREFNEDRLFPLGTIAYEDLTIPAPADPEWFCEHRYGPEWRTPIAANNDRVPR